MVGHRLWNQEACNWHREQGLSGPDSWVCLEQPLYSPTHFSSHFLICFSIKAFNIQLKNISWGIFSAAEEEDGLSSSSEPALQNLIVCFGFVPCSQWAETWDFEQAWNMKSLKDLKHKISEGSETCDFWQIWKHVISFDRS
jgi:hypothetical protein